MRRRANDGSFGAKYPDTCEDDATLVYGTNLRDFEDAMLAEIPTLTGAINNHRGPILVELGHQDSPPSTLSILDLIEFCWKNVSKPTETYYHSFFSHNHLKFDVQVGRDEFRSEVETIFRRNGIAYELTEEGHIQRLVPAVFKSALGQDELNTGDGELDRLLNAAHSKFLDLRPDARQEMLEALWDGWERLKTLDGPGDKKASTTAMLDRTAGETSPKFRDALEKEAINLTWIGNNLRIRHSEVDKELIASNEHADYLFYRLYSLIRLIIRSRQ